MFRALICIVLKRDEKIKKIRDDYMFFKLQLAPLNNSHIVMYYTIL